MLTPYLDAYPVRLEPVGTPRGQPSIAPFPVFVISLEEDVERRAWVRHILGKLNVEYTLVLVQRVSPDVAREVNERLAAKHRMRPAVLGCLLSHLWCMRHAIQTCTRDTHFLVLEDDVQFHRAFPALLEQLRTVYRDYELVQLGACDFHAKQNAVPSRTAQVPASVRARACAPALSLYRPTQLALGAYGNLYHRAFAQMLLRDKTAQPREFDMGMEVYYERYRVGVCLPNLVTAELSSTNLGHDFSPFSRANQKAAANQKADAKPKRSESRFVASCFPETHPFQYTDYWFLWTLFVKHCRQELKSAAPRHRLTQANYRHCVRTFQETYPHMHEVIQEVLDSPRAVAWTDVQAVLDAVAQAKGNP